MAATLIDSVLQAGMNYKSVVYPRVYNILSKYSDYRTTCDFIILFQTIPIEEIIQWKNKRKQDTICELTWYLYKCNVNTEDDLAKWILDIWHLLWGAVYEISITFILSISFEQILHS